MEEVSRAVAILAAVKIVGPCLALGSDAVAADVALLVEQVLQKVTLLVNLP